jgi:hypothetical protein
VWILLHPSKPSSVPVEKRLIIPVHLINHRSSSN